MASAAVHIAILPTPGLGHLIPLSEFAKKLHHRHCISTTFIIPNDGPLSAPQQTLLAALPPAIDYRLLPSVDFSDLPPDVRAETRISLTVARSLPAIHAAVKSLLADQTKKIAALVVDLFGTDGFEIARDFGIPPYIFYPSTATCLSLFFHLPELDKTVSSEYRDLPEPLRLPGCIPIKGSDLLNPIQDRKNDAYKWVLHHARRYPTAEGIIVNTFKKLEPGRIEALRLAKIGNPNPNLYPIGPLIKTAPVSDHMIESSDCLTWLDRHPIDSVLYVSFGSGGSLSHDQIIELALGLELSEQRFLWIIRCPNDRTSSATYFRIHDSRDPLSYLPDGFVDRTKGRGLVVPLWGPQPEILAHGSTGGFLTHCGWNSTLESVVHGIPMILWPLYAEQRMNAVMLHEDVKVGLRPKAAENGVVGRSEVARIVKVFMEGEEGKAVRSRMRDLKIAAAEAVGENGASTKALDELAEKWRNSG